MFRLFTTILLFLVDEALIYFGVRNIAYYMYVVINSHFNPYDERPKTAGIPVRRPFGPPPTPRPGPGKRITMI